MVVDETKAGLQRVLDALTTTEPNDAAAPPETSPAAATDTVALWYQPKIDVKQRCLAGAEAFARIGGAPPAADLSEDDMVGVAEQALLAALRDWTAFDAVGFNLRMSINVPVALLDRLPIATIFGENRPKAGHWPGLIVEISEDQIARDIKRSQEIAPAAPAIRPTRRSARPRSTSRTASAAPRSPKASRPSPISRRCRSWAAISPRAG
jgi:predicted signal transduction protein with EAL and GGDEF domain